MTQGRIVLLWLAVAMATFSVTHFAYFPGSLQYVMKATGGQKILDMKPSASAEDTYQRLASFGPLGREAYLKMIYTVDLVFPTALFAFLLLFARFVSKQKAGISALYRVLLLGAPLIYFVSDLIENSIILTLLSHYPERFDFLAGVIGYFIRLKRFALLASLLFPLIVWFSAGRNKAKLEQISNELNHLL